MDEREKLLDYIEKKNKAELEKALEQARERGKQFLDKMVKDLISVQPMDEAGKAFKELYELSKSKSDLKKEGYKPVSRLGLLWVKKNG